MQQSRQRGPETMASDRDRLVHPERQDRKTTVTATATVSPDQRVLPPRKKMRHVHLQWCGRIPAASRLRPEAVTRVMGDRNANGAGFPWLQGLGSGLCQWWMEKSSPFVSRPLGPLLSSPPYIHLLLCRRCFVVRFASPFSLHATRLRHCSISALVFRDNSCSTLFSSLFSVD